MGHPKRRRDDNVNSKMDWGPITSCGKEMSGCFLFRPNMTACKLQSTHQCYSEYSASSSECSESWSPRTTYSLLYPYSPLELKIQCLKKNLLYPYSPLELKIQCLKKLTLPLRLNHRPANNMTRYKQAAVEGPSMQSQ